MSMFSDDDMPIRAGAGPSGVNGNGHAVTNGKHAPRARPILSSEDEDTPLVGALSAQHTSRALVSAHTDGTRTVSDDPDEV